LYYGGRALKYEFVNTNGELIYEEEDVGEVLHCTANDECLIYKNDSIFLKKFGQHIAHFAIENKDDYSFHTFHPDDKHHYVSLRKWDESIISIYQLKLDTLDTGLADNIVIQPLHIYPNPASDAAYITLPVHQNYHIQLINLQGSIVYDYKTSGNTLKLNRNNLPAGTYFIKLSTSGAEQFNGKLIWID